MQEGEITLIDMHAHCSKISRCYRRSIQKVLEEASDFGMDGIVLTNHYDKLGADAWGADAFVKIART